MADRRIELVNRRAVVTISGAFLIAPLVQRTVAARLSDAISLLDVLGDEYDPDTDDASSTLLTAAEEAATAGKTLIVGGRIRLANCATFVEIDDLHIHFDSPVIEALDDGATTTLSNSAVGQVALHFRACDRLRLTGAASILGKGTPEETPLGGVVYDSLSGAVCDVTWTLDNMGGGVFTMWCEHCQFGDIFASRMWGAQVFDTGTAGSALISCGNYDCSFGRTTSYLNYKPILYASVATTPVGARTDNERCSFGLVQGTAASDPIEGSLITLRSAINCTFVGANGAGFAHGLIITRYASDSAYEGVDGNVVGHIVGNFASTGSSLDGAVIQELGDAGAPAIGHNTVRLIDAVVAGESGVSCTTGSLQVGLARISGGTRPIELKNCTFTAETLICEGQNQEAVLIAQGVDIHVGLIDIRSGSIGGVSSAVRFDPDYPGGTGGRGKIDIGEIRYAHNGVGTDVVWVYMDLAADGSADQQRIGHIRGTGTTAPARFGVESFSVDSGRYRSTAAPTDGD